MKTGSDSPSAQAASSPYGSPASPPPLTVTEETVSLHTLESLNQALERSPDRADLWMLRFATLKALHLAPEFALRLQEAWRRPALRRRLDAVALRRMWDALAPEEPLPDNVHLPGLPGRPADHEPLPAWVGFTLPSACRFSERALRVSGEELTALGIAYRNLRARPGFLHDYARTLGPPLKRPSPLQLAEGLSRHIGGRSRIYLKREDLRRVSAEQENAMAQAYLGRLLGSRTLVTDGVLPQHAVEVAEAARYFNLNCLVVVPSVELHGALAGRLRAVGARLVGPEGLKLGTDDPREAALLLWARAPARRHLAPSLAMGPPPYTTMITDFLALLGLETELQLRAQTQRDRLRTYVSATHSEADSLGLMLAHLARPEIELIFADPEDSQKTCSSRLAPYNGFRREHTVLRMGGRCRYVPVSDAEAREAQRLALRLEDVALSLEDARALAFALLHGGGNSPERDLVVLAA